MFAADQPSSLQEVLEFSADPPQSLDDRPIMSSSAAVPAEGEPDGPRPGTAASGRPDTAGSRPGTASKGKKGKKAKEAKPEVSLATVAEQRLLAAASVFRERFQQEQVELHSSALRDPVLVVMY